VPHRPSILINLIIVAAFVRLVSKEMNSRVVNPTDFLLCFEMLQAVCLVPSGGEDVEGDLTTN